MVKIKEAKLLYTASIQILKDVQLRNGACLATPKGERYSYIYPRDHCQIILGMLDCGLTKRAKKGIEFLIKTQLDSGSLPQRIDVHGNNASYKSSQIDVAGLFVHVFCDYIERTGDLYFAEKHWMSMKNIAGYILDNVYEDKGLVYANNSIHEFPPTESGHEIWANAICQSALMKLAKLAEKIHHPHPEWQKAQILVREGIMKYMWSAKRNTFLKTIRVKESSSILPDADASKYALADYGTLDDKDYRIKAVVKEIEKELWHKKIGGICKYPKTAIRDDGGWGASPQFTLMLCRHHIRTLNREKASKYIDWVINCADDKRLPEHISTRKDFEEYITEFTEAGILRKDRLLMIERAKKNKKYKKGMAYITLPLAWPHSEFIRTWNLFEKTFL